MKHQVTWVEIPATDMTRAMQFYQQILGFKFVREDVCSYDFAMICAEDKAITGALVVGENYHPRDDGPVIYLNGGEDLAVPLAKIAELGNQIIIPKTAIKEGANSYFAQFIDSEGNRIGLYSQQ
ncbi:VOC family protein [Aliikangiella maris]|uniref:VOC family protein n=2 Tax=Aliikangiella maris TaxID=3162458 RepID=A0ABV3MUX2_9GAMM